MGLFGDLRKLNQQAKAIDRNYDPGAQMAAGMAQMQQMQATMQRQTADLELLRIGTPGEATFVGLADTGARINMTPMVRLSLLVEPAGRPPYPVTLETLLPMHAMAQAGIGQRVKVQIHPRQADRVLVRWG
jgi:hypothetical protein